MGLGKTLMAIALILVNRPLIDHRKNALITEIEEQTPKKRKLNSSNS